MPTEAFSAEEIDRARSVTPGCVAGAIHLNHAGSSLPPQVVLDAQIGHLEAEAIHGGYEAAGAALDRRLAVYDSIARLIGAEPSEIARTEHATAAWNAAFWSVPMEPGQTIVAHDHEVRGLAHGATDAPSPSLDQGLGLAASQRWELAGEDE